MKHWPFKTHNRSHRMYALANHPHVTHVTRLSDLLLTPPQVGNQVPNWPQWQHGSHGGGGGMDGIFPNIRGSRPPARPSHTCTSLNQSIGLDVDVASSFSCCTSSSFTFSLSLSHTHKHTHTHTITFTHSHPSLPPSLPPSISCSFPYLSFSRFSSSFSSFSFLPRLPFLHRHHLKCSCPISRAGCSLHEQRQDVHCRPSR